MTYATDDLLCSVIRWLPMNGTLTSTPMTGSMIERIQSGANSTMNTATKSETTNPITTAPTVIRNVDHSSGHAWNVYTWCWRRSPEVKIAWIWWSTLPPPPNQCRPLCANDGNASRKTKMTIAATT